MKPAYDRRAIMVEAHRLYRRALCPISFGDALRLAWQRARDREASRRREVETFATVYGLAA